MSHYTVLVVTRDGDYDSALAPFDENIEVKPYVRRSKEDCINEILELKRRYDTNDEHLNREWFEEEWGSTDFTDHEEIFRKYKEIHNYENWNGDNIISTYNPKSKWDWYQLGGRWGGSFKLKEGAKVIKESDKTWATGWEEVEKGYTDHAQFKDIDLTPNPEEVKKAERFWEVVVEGQPLEEGENESDFRTFWKKDYYLEQYENKATYVKCQTELFACALLYNGEWIEAGEMGWWGLKNSTGDSEKDYRKRFYEVIDSLDENDYLSMIDCHI